MKSCHPVYLQAPEVLICPDKTQPQENKHDPLIAYSTQVQKKDHKPEGQIGNGDRWPGCEISEMVGCTAR